MRIFFTVVALSAATLLSTTAYSQTCCIGKACGDEIDNLCGQGEDLEKCLRKNSSQVSKQCRTYLDSLQASHDYEKQMEQEKAEQEKRENGEDNYKTDTTAKAGDTATTGNAAATGGANTSGTSANTGGSGDTGGSAATGGYAPTGPIAAPGGSGGGVNILNGTVR